MINETILNYVQTERARGVADNAIADALLAQGWPPADVASAMTGVVASTAPVSPSAVTFKHLFEGRLMRWQYFTTAFLLGIITAILLLLSAASGFFIDTTIVYIGFAIVYIVAFPISFSLTIRRLHDLDWSGWLVLLNFIPFVNIVFALFVVFKKGTDGVNSYGPPQAERGFIDTLLNR